MPTSLLSQCISSTFTLLVSSSSSSSSRGSEPDFFCFLFSLGRLRLPHFFPSLPILLLLEPPPFFEEEVRILGCMLTTVVVVKCMYTGEGSEVFLSFLLSPSVASRACLFLLAWLRGLVCFFMRSGFKRTALLSDSPFFFFFSFSFSLQLLL